VTGASEDDSSIPRRGKTTPASKNQNRLIRSAWGVVKRAMHPWDSSLGSPSETWVPVVEVSLAKSWSHASLVDDLLRSS